jgi:hypothetical protein
MADARKGRTGELNADLVKLAGENSALRERVATLEGRVLRLESELTLVLEQLGVRIGGRASKGPPATRGQSKRPPVGPPPLPPTGSKSILPKGSGRKSMIDISEIAELVESLPPPPRTPRK